MKKGRPLQRGESWDAYCDRVDRELREAGEERYPLGFVILIYLIILGLCGLTAWVVFS